VIHNQAIGVLDAANPSHTGIVVDHGLAVGTKLNINFNKQRAGFYRCDNRRSGVFRCPGTVASMRNELVAAHT
jgi:hypothetical protein